MTIQSWQFFYYFQTHCIRFWKKICGLRGFQLVKFTHKMVRKMNVAPPSGHFINLICLTTRNDTDRVTIDGIPNEKTIFFSNSLEWAEGRRRRRILYDLLSIVSPTSLPPSAHVREIRNLILFIRHFMHHKLGTLS